MISIATILLAWAKPGTDRHRASASIAGRPVAPSPAVRGGQAAVGAP